MLRLCLPAPLHPLSPRSPAHVHKTCLPLRGEELPHRVGGLEPWRCPSWPYRDPLCSSCAASLRILNCLVPLCPAGSDLTVPQTPGLPGTGPNSRAGPGTPCTLHPSGGPASPHTLSTCGNLSVWCCLSHHAVSQGSLLPSAQILNIWYPQPRPVALNLGTFLFSTVFHRSSDSKG